MTLKQRDLCKRARALVAYLYENEMTVLSDALQHGHYKLAYNIIKQGEERK